ncbi:glycosyltransferase [Actinomycetes bacterium M1A6_2h]
MNIVFTVSGTRGDVQPAVVLGSQLQRRGHDVTMGVPPNLEAFSAGAGLKTRHFGYDTRAHMNSDLVRHGTRTGSLRQRTAAVAELWNYGWDDMVEDTLELTDGADLVVTGVTTEQIALTVAEKREMAFTTMQHAPIRRNSQFSPVPAAPDSLPPWATLATWSAYDHLLWTLTRRRENTLRRRLGLPTVRSGVPERIEAAGGLEIQAYDPALCPDLAADWAAHRPFVGFLDLDPELRASIGDGAEHDDETESWIAQGLPPIYVGFGSMPVPDPAALVRTISASCAALGERALISMGWNEFGATNQQDDRVRVVGAVNHDRLFPLCRAVVHHGGAGSTAAGLRAGKPTLVCWVSSDQPFWGSRVTRLGLGASTPLRGMTVETLTTGLRTVLSPETGVAAATFAQSMVTPQDAAGRTADLVEAQAAST